MKYTLLYTQSRQAAALMILALILILPSCYFIMDRGNSNDPKDSGYIASSVSTLKELTPSSGNLYPAFDKATTSYSLNVPFNTSSVTVTSVSDDFNSLIKVNGTSVSSGSASQGVPLSTWTQGTITVSVTSEDGSSTTVYTIAARRVVMVFQTGQSNCYDSDGNTIVCAGTGQDGEFQIGFQWPSPRFTDNSDGTLTDNATGLIWLKEMNCISTLYPSYDTTGTAGDGAVTWQEALNFVTGVNAGTYNCSTFVSSNWRLPNRGELLSISNFGSDDNDAWINSQGFDGILSIYWSSSVDASTALKEWRVDLRWPQVNTWDKSFGLGGGLATAVIRNQDSINPLPETGALYDVAYADNYAYSGVTWPNPRFQDNGDGTVLDILTGLNWMKNANVMPTSNPGFDTDSTADDGRVTWQHALDFIAALNSVSYLGYSDWRLPNINELRSLIHLGIDPGPMIPADHLFTNFPTSPAGYHTSTSLESGANNSWYVFFDTGEIGAGNIKTNPWYVLPVRGGH